MTRYNPKEGTKLAVAGVLIGLVAAGFKRRQLSMVTSVPEAGPRKLSLNDWKKVAAGVREGFGQKNIPSLAAGVAYYSVLSLFPMLAAAVAVSALLITSEQLDALISTTEAYLPGDISGVISVQLQNLVSRRADNVIVAAIALAIALFSASGASKNLVIASNAVYEVKESRGWLAQQAWGIIWVIGSIVFGFLFLALLAVNETLLEFVGFPGALTPWLLYGRWIVILLFTVIGLAIFYRYGPNRPTVRWQWVRWGASAATVLWFIATLLFFGYVQNFANYGQSYSFFAGIIVLMIWMNLTALIVLLGAEINHQLEIVGRKQWNDSLGAHSLSGDR